MSRAPRWRGLHDRLSLRDVGRDAIVRRLCLVMNLICTVMSVSVLPTLPQPQVSAGACLFAAVPPLSLLGRRGFVGRGAKDKPPLRARRMFVRDA